MDKNIRRDGQINNFSERFNPCQILTEQAEETVRTEEI